MKILKALSDEKRFKLFALLLKAKDKFYVCEITDALGESQYNISKYLKELKNANLVIDERVGRGILYSITAAQDTFMKKLFEAINSIKNEEIEKAIENLRQRALLRENNKCVATKQSFAERVNKDSCMCQ